MRINYNVSAMLSRNALLGNDNLLSQSLERLSSGLKINHAKDNPAGLAMAKRMNAQIEGLSRATDNANDGISVIETAEGSMSEISEMLQRLNELAVKAANGVMADSDRLTVQDEVAQLKEEITRVAETTEFNGQKLLNGEFNLRGYVYGDVDIKVASYSKEVTVKEYLIQQITLRKEIVDTPAKDEKGNPLYRDNLDNFLYKNNEGKLIDKDGNEVNKREMTDTLEKNADGQAIYKDNDGKRFYKGTNGELLDADDPADDTKKIANDAYVTAELTWTGDYIAEVTGPGPGDTKESTGFPTGYTAKMTKDNLLTITGPNYFELTLDLSRKNQNGEFAAIPQGEEYVIPDPTDTNVHLPLKIDVTGIGAMRLQVGPNEGQVLPVEIPNISLRNMGIENMDVSTAEGALKGIDDVDGAVRYVSRVRGMLGAYQNRLESTVSSLDITSENMTAAYSRVIDVDMAEEMTNYSSYQVLTQAGTSMLAQANQRPSQVLQLLQ